MVQILGIIEVAIFYCAYFLKLFNQNRRGIKTNQLGKGNKSSKTIIIESLLKFASMAIVAGIVISAILNTSIFKGLIIRSIGLVLFALGTSLFIIAMVTMKDSWRAGIPIEGNTTMVTTGIYKFSRNPAFLGFDLTYIGACLTFGNIALLIISLITITLMHLQILEEEQFLEHKFENEYLQYKSKVGRYFIFF